MRRPLLRPFLAAPGALALLLVPWIAAPCVARPEPPPEPAAGSPALEVHGAFSPDEGFAASAWWFRTERGSVLVNAPLLLDHAELLRKEMEAAGGFPGAVLLLSSRPEASWGAAALAAARTRTWTSKAIAATLETGARSTRDGLLRSGLSLERLPSAPPRPTNTFSGTLNLGFEGFTLRLIELSEAGPSAPLVAFIPETGDLFAGDLLASRVHPETTGLDHRGWQRSLDALARLRPRRVFPGRGAATGPDALGALRRYLETIEESVQGFVAKGKRRMGGREVAAARAKVLKRYPDWRLPETLDRTLPAEYARQYRLRFDAEP